MITENSISSIYTLAGLAEKQGVVVIPHANTPLAVLNSSVAKFSAKDSPEPALTCASSVKDALGNEEHAQALDEMVTIAADAVRRQLKFARELVRPVVTDVFEQVNKYLDETPIAELSHHIEEVKLPEVYLEAGLADMVERFKNQPQIELRRIKDKLPDFSAEELAERCKTGMSRVDEKLAKLIEDSPEAVTRVWDEWFGGEMPMTESVGSHHADYVIAFALARNLNTNVPDGVSMSLGDYREFTAFYVAEFGRRIYQTLRRQDRVNRQNELVVYMPPATDPSEPIRVNSEVYQRFLKEGGEPEAIIGACLRDINRPSYADLLEDAYGGKKAVVQNQKLIENRIVVEYEANVQLAIVNVLKDVIAGTELPEGMAKPTLQEVRGYLREYPFRKRDNLDDYVMRVVCDVVFPKTNAYPVLSGIMGYMARDTNLTNREAATLVTIDLVGEWLSAQLTTEAC